jgi:transcriptional regulator with XRE-family HTH domain
MARKTTIQHPSVQRLLRSLGENIRLARLRRGFSAALVAERAGMSRTTLRAIERGEAGVTLGAYANVLHSLGLHEDIGLLASDDTLGRKLQDAQLPSRGRSFGGGER